jgi:hypothetical protein
MMRIALLPLDERPVNTRYPALIAAAADAEIALPPPELLSRFRQPADPDALAAWLRQTALSVDGVIVSLEMLGSGGLIASRLSHEPAAQVAARLSLLADLKRAHPHLPIYAFTVITRTPNYNDAIEEPDYWEAHGAALHALSALYDRRGRGEALADAIAAAEAGIPPEIRRDWLTRRLRNHALNLTALDLLAHDALDLLVISSDDTSLFGLGTREKAWIAAWGGLALPDDPRLLMYPGADEIGCALLARMLLGGRALTCHVEYAFPSDAARTAPYEDGAVSITVERQIAAVGMTVTHDPARADLLLRVNPPSPLGREYDPAHAADERAYRAEPLEAWCADMRAHIDAGRRVILADVAYPNGSDPALIDALIAAGVPLDRLASYGAWNTAGNTIGAALAHGVSALLGVSESAQAAHARFLAHRFVEDWAYQHLVREETRAWLEAHTGSRDVTPHSAPFAVQQIGDRLADRLATLPGIGDRWRIAVGSVRQPWGRMFEVDFDLFPMADEVIVDVAVIGGGMGGAAAALRAAAAGLRVALFEPTAAPGGQMTVQGVSALDEHPHIEKRGGAPASYHALREAIRAWYMRVYGVPAIMPESVLGAGKPLNPGDGWVSRLCFDPRIGRHVLEGMLHEAGDRLSVCTRCAPLRADMDGARVVSVTLHDARRDQPIIVRAAQFIDATELGDLLPLTGTAYVTGAEARADTGEALAPDDARPGETQGFTVCFFVEYRPGEDHSFPAPEGYAALRDSGAFTLSPVGRDGVPVEYRFFETSPSGNPPFWTYRRIHSGALLGGNDIALINWVSNDYHARGLIDVLPSDADAALDEAKRLSLGFLHWLHTECPRDDGGRGYPELKLRADITDTADGLAAAPYVRESRRIIARTRITAPDITAETQPGATARIYPDSVGIGWYAMDLHPCVGNPRASLYAPTKPFHLPLGALIPVTTRNLIAGCKNIGTTHLTNGAYRLHPVEWAIGEAAGALAAECVLTGRDPGEIHDDAEAVRAVQGRLMAAGVPIDWSGVNLTPNPASQGGMWAEDDAKHGSG